MIMSPDGKDTVTVYARTAGRVGNPVLSKNGEKALFSYDAVDFQNELGQQMDALIGLLTIKPSDPKGVVSPVMESGDDAKSKKERGTNDLDPRFSPDGAKIIFTNGSNTGRGAFTVMVADFDGKNGQNRTVLSKGAEMPYWR
jgi:Tol biopolymer transport system component